MTTAQFCHNLRLMATRSMRVPASALLPGDYLVHSRRLVTAVETKAEWTVVTTRTGMAGMVFVHHWLESTPVLIAPRPLDPDAMPVP